MKRFALYFAPAQDAPLTQLAAAWLGRDAWSTTEPLPHPPCNGFAPEVWQAATADPRVYGFHATLKPPFRLFPEYSEEQLFHAVRRFSREVQAFEAPALQVSSLSHFLALTLSAPSAALEDLAARCVSEFDCFRMPPSAEELARRRSARLTPRQLEHLERWGYPYVMEEWRFHMTLTSSLEPALFEAMGAHLRELFAPHCREPLRIDSVCLFEQPDAGEPFRIVERFPLA